MSKSISSDQWLYEQLTRDLERLYGSKISTQHLYSLLAYSTQEALMVASKKGKLSLKLHTAGRGKYALASEVVAYLVTQRRESKRGNEKEAIMKN